MPNHTGSVQQKRNMTLPCLPKAEISGQESERRQVGSEHALASGRYVQPAMPPRLEFCFRVQDSRCRVHGVWFRVLGFGFCV